MHVCFLGFTLSGTLHDSKCGTGWPSASKLTELTASVSFDRRRITETYCSSHPSQTWCKHVVALIFHRIDHPESVEYRLPISDSVQKLSFGQQKRLLNLLLSEFRPYILAPAQSILDKLLLETAAWSNAAGDDKENTISVPDPTAEGELGVDAHWCMQEKELEDIVEQYCFYDHRAGRFLGGESEEEEMNTSLKFRMVLERFKGSSTFKGIHVPSTVRHCLFGNGVVCPGVIRLPSFFADKYDGSKRLETLIDSVAEQLKTGDSTIVNLLSTVTEQWLLRLEKMAGLRRLNPREVVRHYYAHERITFDISQESSQLIMSSDVYPKNVDLINVSRYATM